MLNNQQAAVEDPHAIVSRRTFSWPAASLWRAFSEPRLLERWWGPAGFTSEIEEHDLRVGGVWRFILRGPDGAAYPNFKRFVEIEEPSLLVMRHEQAGHDFTMTIRLEPAESGSGVRVTWVLRFDDLEEAERLRQIILGANEQNFDRLEELVSGL